MTDTNDLVALSNALADAVEKGAVSTILVNARPRLPASGVAFDRDLVLTSSHVVEREDEISVMLPDGSEVKATLAGRDPGTDLALLRLANASTVPAMIASKQARVGQFVLALGRPSPGGIQASQGIVSAVGGPLRTRRASVLDQFIQTDAIPYPGFSGGPLVDIQGQVLGINTSGIAHGTSLTIPADLAWKVADALRTNGRVRRGYLGIRTQVVELPASLQSKLGRSQSQALMVISVETGSAAENSGLIVGDILVGIDGQPLLEHDDLIAHLLGDAAGKTLSFELLRGGEMVKLPVKVGER